MSASSKSTLKSALTALVMTVFAPAVAHAEEPVDALPGSPRPDGIGLSPDAPPKPAAAGGRAPSFGAPAEGAGDWSFRFGGKFEFATSMGISERLHEQPGQSGLALRVPSRVEGSQPFQKGAKAGLFMVYGNSLVSATVNFGVGASGREHEGYYSPSSGPNVSQAYLTLTPQPLGALRLNAKVGAFSDAYGSPGQWGWGLFGPMLAVRGYGEVINAEYDLTPALRATLSHGILGVTGVPEFFVRGDPTGWNDTGVSTLLHHAHAGLTYQNKYVFKLHAARASGTDERKELLVPNDGTMDVYVAEGHWYPDQFGQLGVSGGLWRFDDAVSVHDGIWWGVDWTLGAKDMASKFLGINSAFTGRVAAISAQYEFSLARILWHPLPFDGRSPDLGIVLAVLHHWTLLSNNPDYEGTKGYKYGAEFDYRMLSWLSATLRTYGQSRHADYGRWEAYSLSPGVAFRGDWQSAFKIEVVYTRHFYSDRVDSNSEDPLNRNVLSMGAQVEF